MGAIMGGLYAIGYSGDELKKMALEADWAALLSNKLPFRAINIEEKDEYGRYIIETPLINGRLKLPRGFIEGQVLQEYLLGLTYAARHIHCFDDLPIPFRCIAADIKTGKSVLITEGSLPEAMRTSMSIPLIFTPIEQDSFLLVDGGLARNFPVKEVFDMGATTVIGSYTGFRILGPNELGDGSKLLLQSIGLLMSGAPDEDKKLCDMWVNNELPKLYSTNFDYSSVVAIIKAGEANARAMLPELLKIREWQRAQGERPKRVNLKADTTVFTLKSVETHADNARTATLIKRKFGIESGKPYKETDFTRGLNQLYGSLFFNKIGVSVDSTFDDTHQSIIRLHAFESAKSVFKFGAHYDTDDAAGLLMNGTFRNLLGYNSRLVATIDAAEQPKARLKYYQFMGSRARFRWTFDGLFERSIRNDFLFIKASDGLIKSRDKYQNTYLKAAVGVQFIANKNGLFFFEVRAVNDANKPQRDPRNIPVPNTPSFLNNQSSHYGVVMGGLQNTLNTAFFPTKGQKLSGEIKFGFGHNADLTTYTYNDTIKKGIETEFVTSSNQSYIRYRLAEERWIPLSENWSLGLQANLGAGFSVFPAPLSKNKADNPETFYIGGTQLSERDNALNFMGLRKAEIEFSQFLELGVSAQYHFRKNFYFTPTANIGRFSDNHNAFYSNILDWEFVKETGTPTDIQAFQATHILGYGLNVGYMSRIGPINLLVHSNTFTKSTYVFFSFGFKMP